MEEKKNFDLFVTYRDHDFDDDVYELKLDLHHVDCLLHALNEFRSNYCVHSKEYKTIQQIFDFMEFVYNEEKGEEDEI